MRSSLSVPVCLFVCITVSLTSPSHATDLAKSLWRFEQHTGATLVFSEVELPPGKYFDVLVPLETERRSAAAEICLREAYKYPPGYLGRSGLRVIGIFAACVSRTGDGFRPFDEQLRGYRYYGVYNARDGIAAAFYSANQLPQTFHHEVFHHIDATHAGATERWQLSSDDAFYQAAVSGRRRYAAPTIVTQDLLALQPLRTGFVLRDAVSEYAAKNAREDQAETARHFMTGLPDALHQMVAKPNLPGSQRLMHILHEYEQAVPGGPGVDWFVDVALDRVQPTVPQLIERLEAFAVPGESGFQGVASDAEGARETLLAAARLEAGALDASQARKLISLSAKVTEALMRRRIRPDMPERRFIVWGHEDDRGINHTLRADLNRFADDARRLAQIIEVGDGHAAARAQLKSLRLLARYFVYIDGHWSVTPGTRSRFEAARAGICDALTAGGDGVGALHDADFDEIAGRIDRDGRLKPRQSS